MRELWLIAIGLMLFILGFLKSLVAFIGKRAGEIDCFCLDCNKYFVVKRYEQKRKMGEKF